MPTVTAEAHRMAELLALLMRQPGEHAPRALVNSGFIRLQYRVVINLASADLPKPGASFDLPITIG
jgi:predicted ATPase with chaperone activity